MLLNLAATKSRVKVPHLWKMSSHYAFQNFEIVHVILINNFLRLCWLLLSIFFFVYEIQMLVVDTVVFHHSHTDTDKDDSLEE